MQAKLFCETVAMNGFKTGRLFEPKTQYFNDKVFDESLVVFGGEKTTWIGINSKGGPWGYTSSRTELEFENWYPGQPNTGAHAHDCGHIYSSISNVNGKWGDANCNMKFHFICEFF